jgi:purine-binding chemotaxis protein CheW
MKGSIQFLVFSLDERPYAVRLSQTVCVIHAVDYTALPQSPGSVLGVIDLHGQVVPLLDIRKRFGCIEREVRVEDRFIIARTSRRTVALAVDVVTGVVERPAGDVIAAESILPHMQQIEGVIQLEDGLVLIHDLDRFLSLEEDQALEQAVVGKLEHGT